MNGPGSQQSMLWVAQLKPDWDITMLHPNNTNTLCYWDITSWILTSSAPACQRTRSQVPSCHPKSQVPNLGVPPRPQFLSIEAPRLCPALPCNVHFIPLLRLRTSPHTLLAVSFVVTTLGNCTRLRDALKAGLFPDVPGASCKERREGILGHPFACLPCS